MAKKPSPKADQSSAGAQPAKKTRTPRNKAAEAKATQPVATQAPAAPASISLVPSPKKDAPTAAPSMAPKISS